MKKLFCVMMAWILLCAAASAEEFHLIFHGDWDKIKKVTYQDEMADLFESAYPRLYARWGMKDTPLTIYYKADYEDHDSVAYSYSNHVVVSVDYANNEPYDLVFFSHELMHSIQGYGEKLIYGGDAWWTENMANYGRFRYYHWADESQLEPESTDYRDWMDWGYQPYGNCQWFFAYMDDKYPTTMDENGSLRYGLIDSVHRLIKSNTGDELEDNPFDPETPINKTVYEITGFESFEALRVRFAEELESGTWTFRGFKDYKDNFLTENLPGVENPEYPSYEQAIPLENAQSTEDFSDRENLLKGAAIVGASGFVNEFETPEMLIDGDFRTKWCSTQSHVTDLKHMTDGAKQWIEIDLGEAKSFSAYAFINTRYTEPYYGNMVSWELLVSMDGENWVTADYRKWDSQNIVSVDIEEQTARYLLLKIYDPDNSEVGTIRLYEMMLFSK